MPQMKNSMFDPFHGERDSKIQLVQQQHIQIPAIFRREAVEKGNNRIKKSLA